MDDELCHRSPVDMASAVRHQEELAILAGTRACNAIEAVTQPGAEEGVVDASSLEEAELEAELEAPAGRRPGVPASPQISAPFGRRWRHSRSGNVRVNPG